MLTTNLEMFEELCNLKKSEERGLYLAWKDIINCKLIKQLPT